ncbi:ciliary microtubule associated protein 1A-like [Rhopilema esculentum]|uniref:ciliary microtubule associated protein 1A-like n=1 Tax=Rhopilema esculentum TaxID=499914 RepID=UPI0031D2D5F4|eukprot:gene5123-242_t
MAAEEGEPQKRPTIAAKVRGPGPAKYGLPGLVGYNSHDPTKRRNPAFSFGKRFIIKPIEKSPGPCYRIPNFLTKTGKDTAPSYSLYGKPKEQSNFLTPAPGNYKPEKYPIPNDRKAPSYSFGGRTTHARQDDWPAANAYTLPSLIGPNCIVKPSAAAHSISGRPVIGAYWEDLQKTPGPGTYRGWNIKVILKNNPAYSITGRNFDGQEKSFTPGPGAYSPEKVLVHRKSGPKFSFGIRHTEHMTTVREG